MTMIDVLMVTYRSPERTDLSLRHLLEVSTPGIRVWLWHNGGHARTLDVVDGFRDHPLVHRFHHSPTNVGLREPTNWLLSEGTAPYLSKIDDDNVVPAHWPQPLIDAHEADPRIGVLGSWRFQDEDYIESLASRKIQTFGGGHRVMRNLWVEGSCFVMKRKCVLQQGLLAEGQSFPAYCRALARAGWVNGYYYPFVYYENLDDPRAERTFIKSDSDLHERLPLSAQANGVATVDQWVEQLRRSARGVQEAEFELKYWTGWRHLRSRGMQRLRRLTGDRHAW